MWLFLKPAISQGPAAAISFPLLILIPGLLLLQ